MPLPIPPPRNSGLTTETAAPLYWVSYGPPDGPPLLLLHGGPGASHEYLLPQMLELTDPYRLVLYDQRGGGRSRSDDQAAVTWETHVADLAAVIREQRFEPVTVVGYSWGGLLTLLYSIQAFETGAHPLPARLVLIDPAPVTRAYRAQFEEEFARRQRSEPIRSMREELQQSGLQARDRDAYRQRAFELSVAGYFTDPEKARNLTPFRIIGRVQQSVWESLGDYDLTPRLPAIRCPALLVHGRDDPIPLASSQEAASALRAELVVLEDCGHVPYVERPAELFAAVRRFLAATEPHQ